MRLQLRPPATQRRSRQQQAWKGLLDSLFPLPAFGTARASAVRLRGHPRRWRFRCQEVGAGGPPTEREGAAHELPVVPDSEIRPYLVLCPAQSLLDLLVALLHPDPQPVQSGYLGGVDRRSRYLRSARNLRCPMWPRHAPLTSPTYSTPITPTANFLVEQSSLVYLCVIDTAPQTTSTSRIGSRILQVHRNSEAHKERPKLHTLSAMVIAHIPSNKTLDAFLDGRLGLEPDISYQIVHVGVRR
jgi:hypothetical protein